MPMPDTIGTWCNACWINGGLGPSPPLATIRGEMGLSPNRGRGMGRQVRTRTLLETSGAAGRARGSSPLPPVAKVRRARGHHRPVGLGRTVNNPLRPVGEFLREDRRRSPVGKCQREDGPPSPVGKLLRED
jgi:hypothetical protein